jgi:hypothetical protein
LVVTFVPLGFFIFPSGTLKANNVSLLQYANDAAIKTSSKLSSLGKKDKIITAYFKI